MKLLVDTHLLLCAAGDTLPYEVLPYFSDDNTLFFSCASIWEVITKKGLNRSNFKVDPSALYWGLLYNGYNELEVSSQHALALADLPPIHKDFFDRILIAQAKAEGIALLTSDYSLTQYSPVIYVGR